MSTPTPAEPQSNAATLAPDFTDEWEHRAMTVEYAATALTTHLRTITNTKLAVLLLALEAPGRGGPHALTVVEDQEAQHALVLAVLAERKRLADE